MVSRCNRFNGSEKNLGIKKVYDLSNGKAYSLKLPQVGKRELRTMIGLRKYICAQFKPNVAKMFYDMNEAKTVLDFSMGWGDRLAGAFASETVEHYVGLDSTKRKSSLL